MTGYYTVLIHKAEEDGFRAEVPARCDAMTLVQPVALPARFIAGFFRRGGSGDDARGEVVEQGVEGYALAWGIVKPRYERAWPQPEIICDTKDTCRAW